MPPGFIEIALNFFWDTFFRTYQDGFFPSFWYIILFVQNYFDNLTRILKQLGININSIFVSNFKITRFCSWQLTFVSYVIFHTASKNITAVPEGEQNKNNSDKFILKCSSHKSICLNSQNRQFSKITLSGKKKICKTSVEQTVFDVMPCISIQLSSLLLLISAGCAIPVLNVRTNNEQLQTFKGQGAKNRLPSCSLSLIIQVPACNI